VSSSALENNSVIGIIFSGGPASVYEKDSPHVHETVWKFIEDRRIPVLGICYGMQEIAHHYGGRVTPSSDREYGRAVLTISSDKSEVTNLLFQNVQNFQMWMSHGDKVTQMPQQFVNMAYTDNSSYAAIADPVNKIFGIQFHPEVTHSVHGKVVLHNFVVNACHAPTDWNMKDIATEFIREVCTYITFYILLFLLLFPCYNLGS
jgi:GMP synthase (glutamine-hydrolysing)